MNRNYISLAAILWLSALIYQPALAQPLTGAARQELITTARDLIFGSRKLPAGATTAEIHSRGLRMLHTRALPELDSTELPFTMGLRVEGRNTLVFPEEPALPPDIQGRQGIVDTAAAFRGYFSLMVDCLFTLDDMSFPADAGSCSVVKDSAGYLIKFRRGWDRCETRLDNDLRVVETRAKMGRFTMSIRPTFTSTLLGLVLESATLEIGTGESAGAMTLSARYGMVDGMPLPVGARITGHDMLAFSGESVRAIAIDDTVTIVNYTFEKQ
jgi:hypothetical protein